MIYAVWTEDSSYSDITSDRQNVGINKVNNSAREQHDIAWKLFEYALKKEYGIELSGCTIDRNRWGKPCLREYPNIYFSISHCKSVAVCVTGKEEVGIDVETVGRACNEKVWKRMLSDVEYEALLCIEEESERDKEFLRYWTLKECYGKAIGKGLSYDYKSVVFSIKNNAFVCNVPEFAVWQTIIEKGGKEVIVSVCRRNVGVFTEAIEWVDIK